jgi:hypothetical protein
VGLVCGVAVFVRSGAVFEGVTVGRGRAHQGRTASGTAQEVARIGGADVLTLGAVAVRDPSADEWRWRCAWLSVRERGARVHPSL